MKRDGLQNMFIACGLTSLGIMGLILPMILWGKHARRAVAGRYARLIEKQGYVR